MLSLSTIFSPSLVVGSRATSLAVPSRHEAPVMMPKFLKDAFPDLEKPDDAIASLQNKLSEFAGSIIPTAAPPPVIEVKEPNPAITAAGKAMPLLSPVFNLEADVQALVTNLGAYDEAEVQADIDATIKSAPVVVYTYGLSPFSTEVLDILESTGCKYENVELGAEWFALGGKGSATRVELRKRYGQGSLPHVFIGGEWVGGYTTGAEGGLAGLVERDELVEKLRKARAL
jgi:glutaredoxin-related protein